MTINEKELRHFVRILNHGDMATRVHCQNPNIKGPAGALCSTLVKGEDAIVEWAKQWNKKGSCYVSRNPMISWGKPGPYTCLTFDVDPKYTKSKGATYEESQIAAEAGRWLLGRFTGAFFAGTGNGILLVYKLPPDLSGCGNDAVHRAYKVLSEQLKSELEDRFPNVQLDILADEMRLVRLIGTWNVKGDSENHRIAHFIHIPMPGQAERSPMLHRFKQLMTKAVEIVEQKREITSYEPWVMEALSGLPAGAKHVTIVKLAGYFGGKHIPIELAKRLILEANTHAKDEPASEEDVIFRVEDVYKRIRAGNYRSDEAVESTQTATLAPPFEIGTMADASEEYLKELKARSAFTTPEIPWPFEGLNKMTWGLARGALIAMGAWTGKGKTSIALTLAEYLNRLNKSVLYFPTEMSQSEIKGRYISVATGIENGHMKNGMVLNNADEAAAFKKFYPEFLTRKFYMPKKDMPRLSLYELKRGLDVSNADIVIVDFLQRLSARSTNRRREVAEFIMTLKDEVKQRNIACLVLSQFHRPERAQNGKFFPPSIFDFAECGDIENTSDISILLHPPLDERGYVIEDIGGDHVKPVLCHVAKNRHNGVTGVSYLKVNTLTTKFEDA